MAQAHVSILQNGDLNHIDNYHCSYTGNNSVNRKVTFNIDGTHHVSIFPDDEGKPLKNSDRYSNHSSHQAAGSHSGIGHFASGAIRRT